MADESTASVLEPERSGTKIGQLWAYARDDRPCDPPAVACCPFGSSAACRANYVITCIVCVFCQFGGSAALRSAPSTWQPSGRSKDLPVALASSVDELQASRKAPF